VRAVPVICLITFLLRALAAPLHIPIANYIPAAWYQVAPGFAERAATSAGLERLPGSQLVIVRYKPGHNLDDEWVYNAANIDAAKIVWARDMGAVENQDLIQYFAARRVWLLDADDHPPRLSPYPTEVPLATASSGGAIRGTP
jgi:hypothetical protein